MTARRLKACSCGRLMHRQPLYIDWLPGMTPRAENPLTWFHLGGTLGCEEGPQPDHGQRVGRCHYCGRDPVPLTRDHVVPLSRGGSNRKENIIMACGPCNSFKADRLLSELPRDWPRTVLAMLASPSLTSRNARRLPPPTC